MQVEHFYDIDTYTLTYLVYDAKTKDAVLIDPVLNYEANSSTISFQQLELIKSFIDQLSLNLHYSIETHAHADHLSSSVYLKKYFPQIKIGISKNITKVQSVFKDIFNFKNLKTDGSQFDLLFSENEVIQAGSINIKIIETPGHTPACTSLLIEDMLFTGDSLFMPDYGTGRCDFPAGCSSDLYNSVHNKIYTLPEETKIFVGHDYQPGGRELKYQTTVKESKEQNIQLKYNTTKEEFIEFRNKRDKTLNAPKLLLQSVQVNINAGHFQEAEDNKTHYLKIPLTLS